MIKSRGVTFFIGIAICILRSYGLSSIALSGLLQKIFKALQERKFILFINVLEKAAFFILFIVLARAVSKPQYGEIASLFAFANILFSFFEAGFSFYFQRESAAGNPRLPGLFTTAYAFRLALALPFILIVVAYGNSSLPYLSLSIAFAVFLFGTNNLANALLLGKREYGTSFYYLLLSRSIMIGGIVVFTVVGITNEWILFSLTASAVLHNLLLARHIRGYGIVINRSGINPQALPEVFKASLPMALGAIMVWLYDRSDIILLKQYLGSSAVAVYTVAYAVYKLPQAFSGFLLTPLYSDFSSMYSRVQRIVTGTFLRHGLVILIFGIGNAVLLWLAGEWFTVTVYGELYRSSAAYLPVLALGVPALLLNNLTGVALNAGHLEKQAAFSVMYSAFLNIALNVVLIPKYGIMGSAIGSVAAEYCTLAVQLLYLRYYKLIRAND